MGPTRRFLFLVLLSSTLLSAAGLAVLACATSDEPAPPAGSSLDAGRRDSALVDPPEAGTYDGAPSTTPPTCEKYCDLVTSSCDGTRSPYAAGECIALCPSLPLGKAGELDTATIACRQYYAGTPAKTDPMAYCAAAGPFGGGVCGDRCTAFCQLTLAKCGPDAGFAAPYPSYPECAVACAGFPFRDAGANDEGLGGPDGGNTLNCRLHFLREAARDPSQCSLVGPDSGACR